MDIVAGSRQVEPCCCGMGIPFVHGPSEEGDSWTVICSNAECLQTETSDSFEGAVAQWNDVHN